MKVVRLPTAADLLEMATPWLMRAEAENSLLIGIAQQQADSGPNGSAKQFWAAVVDDNGDVAGCAFRTPPYPLSLTKMPAAAVPLLIPPTRAPYPDLPGVAGSSDEARSFAESWSARFDVDWSVRVGTRLHCLTRVRFPEQPPAGRLRRPAGAETAMIREWAADFIRDTRIPETPDDFADKLLSSALYVWDDRGPRCMIAVSRETENGASISGVYTPPSSRQRGYASAAVATVSATLLESGKRFCCLYTDVANPVSNAIYGRIGYRPVRDDIVIDFSARQRPST